jgi:putative DNA primase/helicase
VDNLNDKIDNVKIDNVNEIRSMVAKRVKEEEAKYGRQNQEPPKPTSLFVRQCFRCNELGDGILYQALNQDELLHNKSANQWMVWQGHHWTPDIMGVHKARVEKVSEAYLNECIRLDNEIKKSSKDGVDAKGLKALQTGLFNRVKQLRSTVRLSHCTEFAHNKENPMAIRGDEIDQKPWLLACSNCVIELKTGSSRPGRPDDYLLTASPTEFVGYDAPRPLWEKALDQVFLGKQDLIDFFQRIVGMALVGETIEHAIIVLWGAGCNGKSLLVETISSVLGNLVGPIPTEMLLSQGRVRNSAGPTPDLMSLKGLRLAYASEADEGVRFSESRVKWLTGGDRITGRNPHDKHPVSFAPSHTLFLLTNSRPGAPGHDFAFWRRIHLLEFGAQFIEHPSKPNEFKIDKHLGRKLRDEASGILAWIVEGCLLWQKYGLNPPVAVVESTAQYRSDEDLVGQFIEDCCELDLSYEVGATDLYNCFVEWFHEAVGKKEPTQKTFGTWVVRRFERSKGKPRKYFGLRIV